MAALSMVAALSGSRISEMSRASNFTLAVGSLPAPQTSPRSEVLVEEEEEVGRQGGKWSPVEFKVLGWHWQTTDLSIVDAEHEVQAEDDDEDEQSAPR